MGDGEFIVTGDGIVSRYNPAAAESEVLVDGLDALYGVAVSHSGTVVTADLGAGKVYAVTSGAAQVVADGLNEPIGVTFASNGTALVSEAGAGRILSITGSGVDTLIDGLERPEGIVVHDGTLFIVDVDAKTSSGSTSTPRPSRSSRATYRSVHPRA